MNKIVYKTDEGCRKGCHPVVHITEQWDGRKKKTVQYEDQIFSIDEPGAWYEDKWNCHVDGCDYPFKSRFDAIIWGLCIMGYLDFEEEHNEKWEKMQELIEKV